MQKRKFILMISCLLFLFSCGKEHLDREYAKAAIIQEEGFPKPVAYEFFKIYLKDYQSTGLDGNMNVGVKLKEVEVMINFWENKGLITLNDQKKSETKTAFLFGTTTRTWIYTHIELTELGKKYLVSATKDAYKVKIWECGVSQVVGIKELNEQKIAEVNFQVVNQNITPFGEYFADRNKVEDRTASFTLYDDGWRIN